MNTVIERETIALENNDSVILATPLMDKLKKLDFSKKFITNSPEENSNFEKNEKSDFSGNKLRQGLKYHVLPDNPYTRHRRSHSNTIHDNF